ncbi:hypothetical protein CXB51_024461 [Gossypium anomalum]|uniref:Reverse transcriptase Ty1/copia-type domain-containing protein n=1 Tax=Gossypium anomalum TaxID=47600 RepID=A0A8J5YM79_9ROSI|nr:hypothetical protein CXB51_024461 [Gossypium anomalum]
MARSLLKAKKLPDKFWGKEVATAVYLLNISPANANLNQTPSEAWMGKKPWIAMKEEMHAIKINSTWELVDVPEGKIVVGLKWVFRTKYNAGGNIQKHKAQLVAKGYSQQEGMDFEEKYSPVAHFETVRVFLALTTQLQLSVYQFDVKSAFLNSDLVEEVYVSQPPGFANNGFTRSENEPTLYLKKRDLLKKFGMVDCEVASTPMNINEKLQHEDGIDKIYAKSYKTTLRSSKRNPCYVVGTSSKKQETIALSSSEVEYATATAVARQALWLRKLLCDFSLEQKEATEIFCDNRSTIAMTKNPTFHGTTKYIDVHHHFIRKLVAVLQVIAGHWQRCEVLLLWLLHHPLSSSDMALDSN